MGLTSRCPGRVSHLVDETPCPRHGQHRLPVIDYALTFVNFAALWSESCVCQCRHFVAIPHTHTPIHSHTHRHALIRTLALRNQSKRKSISVSSIWDNDSLQRVSGINSNCISPVAMLIVIIGLASCRLPDMPIIFTA